MDQRGTAQTQKHIYITDNMLCPIKQMNENQIRQDGFRLDWETAKKVLPKKVTFKLMS